MFVFLVFAIRSIDGDWVVVVLLILLLFYKQFGKCWLIKSFTQVRIEAILDGIISTTIHLLSYVTPAIAVYQVQLDNEHILVHCPFALGNVGVEMVVPPLTTLLSNATR